MKRTRVQIPDAGEETLTLVQTESGRPLCTLMEHVDFDVIKNCSMRHDDVILCSYPRSGTHWTWELMRMIVNNRTDNDPVEKETAMFEYQSHGELDRLPSPRILNTHLWFEQFPAEVREKKTKLVLVYRDPKDVAVSFYNLHCSGQWYQYHGQFAHWLPLFMAGKVDWGNYGEYLREWERVMEQHPDIPVHVISYDRLKKNPLEALSPLSQFLGKDHDVTFLQEVYDACAIDKMRTRKEENYVGDVLTNAGARFIYRTGASGGWKNWFTVAMNEQFDNYWSHLMAGSKVFHFE